MIGSGRITIGVLMADREDLEFTYSLIDRIFRLSLGELADFSGAKYDGDFSLSLEEAQRRKHEYVAEQIRHRAGSPGARSRLRVGAAFGFHPHRGGTGVGVTLSSAQVAACRRHGLDVHLYDAREVTRDSFGAFDAVASVGGFEHFCSPDEYLAGRQEEIYRGVFARIASVLPDDGRFYLQTMVWGPNMIPAEQIDIDALRALPERDSDAWVLALLGRQFPGSWLPMVRSRSSAAPSRISVCCQARAAGSTTSRRSPSGTEDRGAQSQKDAVQASASTALAHQLRLPARVHLRRERQQGLLRAGTARALPARVPKTTMRRRMGCPRRRMQGPTNPN